MTKLSVNINKLATLRNSRGGSIPDLLKSAKDIESYGGQGITIHPRPDERHIRYKDAYDLKEIVSTEFNIEGNPIPKFVDMVFDPKEKMVEGAAEIGADRIELYTESFAKAYSEGDKNGIIPFTNAAKVANELGIGINAGHDLSLDNIKFFKENIPNLLEVSIGHALICESIYLGLENVINMYLHRLQ